jgi:hypothetical protein
VIVRVGIEYDGRKPDPLVVRELRLAASPNERVNWLHVEWFAGDPWEPVERFVVYEMIPEATLRASDAFQRQFGHRDEWLAACLGPNPRTMGGYDRVLGRFVERGSAYGGGSLIDRRQWVMFRRWRALAMPVWIVQGSQGGHKRHFTPIEAQLARQAGWEFSEPPAPGELAFAALDRRSVEALGQLDRLRKWAFAIGWRKRTIGMVWRERAQAELEFRKGLSAFIDRQIEDAVREVVPGTKVGAVPREVEESEQEFIHSGVGANDHG